MKTLKTHKTAGFLCTPSHPQSVLMLWFTLEVTVIFFFFNCYLDKKYILHRLTCEKVGERIHFTPQLNISHFKNISNKLSDKTAQLFKKEPVEVKNIKFISVGTFYPIFLLINNWRNWIKFLQNSCCLYCVYLFEQTKHLDSPDPNFFA